MSARRGSRSGGLFGFLRALPMLGGLLALARPVLADGNVTAFVDAHGNLWVVGDGADNSLNISDDTGVTDEFLLRDGWGGTTTVNGLDHVTLVASGPHIFIALRAGNDRIGFGDYDESICCSRSIVIRCDEGDDLVFLNEASHMGPMRVDLGPGNDTFKAAEDSSVEELTLSGGDGDDSVSMLFYSGMRGDTSIDLGPGADELVWQQADVLGALTVDGGPDGDRLVLIRPDMAKNATLTGGSGDDVVEVDGIEVFTSVSGAAPGPLAIDAGDGADRVFLRGSIDLDDVVVETGNGPDHARIEGAQLKGGCAVSLGAEDDHLAVHASAFGLDSKPVVHAVVFDGGTGIDRLLDGGNDYLSGAPEMTGFEAPRPLDQTPIEVTTELVGGVVLPDGEPVPSAVVAIPELGLVSITDAEGGYRFGSVTTRLATLEIAAGATVDDARQCGVVTARPVPDSTTRVGEIVLEPRAPTVLVFGDEDHDARGLETILVSRLGRSPEATFRRRFLPADLTPFQVVWHVGRDVPLTQADRERLSAFVRSGGGLDLAGDGAALHDSHEQLVNALLAGAEVSVVPQGFAEWFPIAYNQDAVGDAGRAPNLLGTVSTFYGGRILAGVAPRNAFIAGASGQVFAAVWTGPELAGGRGRLGLGLISLWLASPENAPGIENLQAFLQGAGGPSPRVR